MQLSPRSWAGCRFIPALKIGWTTAAATPILVTEVKPLKTGTGVLRLTVVPVLYPTGPAEVTWDVRIIQHRENYLIGAVKGVADDEQTIALEPMDFDWLVSHSPDELARIRTLLDKPVSAADGLSHIFGATAERIAASASPADNPGEPLTPLPDRREPLALNREYSEYDSWRISRGVVPHSMDDKWLIYRKNDILHFHRSWTGICIYEVNLGHREGRLYLSSGCANREPREYNETSRARDEASVYYLIDLLLLHKTAALPDTYSGGDAVIQVQSAVGLTMLGKG